MPKNAPKDQNHVFSKNAVLNTDTIQGQHLVPIKINPDTNGIKVTTVDTISFTMVPIDPRDENYRTCWFFEGLDGLTYPAVATANGYLLVEM